MPKKTNLERERPICLIFINSDLSTLKKRIKSTYSFDRAGGLIFVLFSRNERIHNHSVA